MSRDFPDWVDVDRAVEGRRRFAGSLALGKMPRLLDLLDAPEPDAEIDFEIDAWRDDQGTARLDVRFSGALPLTCQRSLERYLHVIDGSSSIAVIEDEAALAGLPENLEPKLSEKGRLKLIELVEDELLLALPLVPRDPALESLEQDLQAGPLPAAPVEEEASPFAALAGLKRGRSDRGSD
ncbi:MAG: DNA-binding protein [Gammaproteobacteria bacterium HGW-Gammaproteobacteria-8]|nr:MAG: DNA-binding protein [Gammaproteobacteria bacterium HGW-Gammaproteobacteria-8]